MIVTGDLLTFSPFLLQGLVCTTSDGKFSVSIVSSTSLVGTSDWEYAAINLLDLWDVLFFKNWESSGWTTSTSSSLTSTANSSKPSLTTWKL